MKRNFYYALFVALMLSTITSCGPEQSELNLETFNTKAVISGTLFYDAGVNVTSESVGNVPSYSVDNYTPLSGQKIYLEVEYDQYVDNNTGTKVYETETDTLGVWQFEIPTTMTGINVRVYMEKLRTFKSSYKEMDGDTPVFETSLYEYTYETTSTLKPNDKVILAPQTLSGIKINDIAGFEEQITLKGNIQQAYETGYRMGAYMPAVNMPVEFKIRYEGLDPITFGTTTDSTGSYAIVLPLRSFEEGFESMEINPKETYSKYQHFSSPDQTMTLTGKYKAAPFSRSLLGNFTEKEYTMPTMHLLFDPNYNNGFTTTTAPASWPKNGGMLAGWLYVDNQKTTTKTISGKSLIAVETEFCKGNYIPSQEVILNVAYLSNSETIYVNADAEGNFLFELPVEENSTEPIISVADLDAGFTHYFKKETENGIEIDSTEIRGSYTYLTSTDNGEWNELGTVYCKFEPESPLDDWYTNLAGWVVEEKLSPKNISGTIFVAKESGFRTGIYEGAPYQPVTVTIVDERTRSFVGATDKTGKYNISVLMRYPDEEPSQIMVTPDFGSTITMTHYRRPDNSTTEEVEVRYGRAFSSYIEGINAWYERGEDYYSVSAVNPGSITNWSENLVGWINKRQEVKNKYTKTLGISGYVKRAVEENVNGEWAEKWVNDPYRLVRAIVDGTAYDIATQDNGNYSFFIQIPETEKDSTVHIITVTPQEDVKDVAFKHHADKKENTEEYITGKYYSAENINNDSIASKIGGINIEPSAKMLFRPTTTPQGWSEYNWDITKD